VPTDPSGFSNIERAYELLGVPDSATTHAIKHAYRVMAKRWHPDLYCDGTPEHAEAVRMMGHINEAYSAIQHAPLRYGGRRNTGVAAQPTEQASRPAKDIQGVPEREHFVAMDKLEFLVRFVCGAIFGILVSVGIALRSNVFSAETQPALVVCLAIIIVLACGFGAARGGDRFWYEIFGR